MSCQKCCLSPCGRSVLCPDGAYYVCDEHGNLTKVVKTKLPKELAEVVVEAVVKALMEEGVQKW